MNRLEQSLTHAEAESLFGDDPSQPGAPTQSQSSTPGDGPRAYDIGNQERIIRGRMQALDIINERFARNTRMAIFNFMQRTAEVSAGPVRVVKYSTFLGALSLPTNFNIVGMKTLRGSCVFILEPSLVFGVVEMMFGGTGKIHTRIEGRDFTPTEQRIIQRLLQMLITQYERAWSGSYHMKLEYVRSEMQPHFVNIAAPGEVVVTSSFSVDLGHAQGSIHIAFPYSSVEPIREILTASGQSDGQERDERWTGLLQTQVASAEVNITVPLTTISATLKQLVKIRQGDVLSMEIPELVTAQADGIPLFECRVGTWNGKYAVRVEHKLDQHLEPSTPAASGGKHAG